MNKQNSPNSPNSPTSPDLDTYTASKLFNSDTEATGFTRKVLQNVLNYYTEKSNLEQERDVDHAVIYNLSLKKILENMAKTLIGLLDDILNGHIHTINDVLKGDRVLYLGLIMVLIAFCVYLIDVTS